MLYIPIANIGQGKSTLAEQFAADGALIVSDDAITLALHGGRYELYQEKYKPLYKLIDYQIISFCSTNNIDCYIDRPINIDTLNRYIGYAKAIDMPYKCILFKYEEPKVCANRRTQSDNRGRNFQWWLDVAIERDSKPALEYVISNNIPYVDVDYNGQYFQIMGVL